ncbi:MAG: hypothetical protein AMJ95_01500 [Omnitrophica WOR_2 bacterium SM23_72]|nr:MAG: hypothetical protein AMJ95_01500 [Omnitrophica WOR_2 bacterium SM23_72]
MRWLKLIKTYKEKKKQKARRCDRISHSLKISYQIANDTLHVECRTKDISESGIRLNLYQKIEIGTVLKLGIYFQESVEPVWVIGKVVWLKATPRKEYPFEAGIEFTFLDSSSRSKFQNHIQDILNFLNRK